MLLVVAGLVAWWASHLYSPRSRRDQYPPEYGALADTLLARAVRHDSAGVAAVTRGREPAAWLAIAGMRDSAVLELWRHGKPVIMGLRSADTTLLYWSTSAAQRHCPGNGDLTVAIVGEPAGPKVVRLSSPCVTVAAITFDFSPP